MDLKLKPKYGRQLLQWRFHLASVVHMEEYPKPYMIVSMLFCWLNAKGCTMMK